jgi:hypothetical protein
MAMTDKTASPLQEAPKEKEIASKGLEAGRKRNNAAGEDDKVIPAGSYAPSFHSLLHRKVFQDFPFLFRSRGTGIFPPLSPFTTAHSIVPA